jgi:hypothetical protein
MKIPFDNLIQEPLCGGCYFHHLLDVMILADTK